MKEEGEEKEKEKQEEEGKRGKRRRLLSIGTQSQIFLSG